MLKDKKILIIIGLGVITILVLVKLAGFRNSLELISRMSIPYLFLAFLIHYSGFFIRTLRWKILLRSLTYHERFIRLFKFLVSGWFISAIVPMRGGDFSRAYLLKRDREIPIKHGLSTILMERTLDGLAILVASMTLCYVVLSSAFPSWITALYKTAVVTFFFLFGVVIVSPRLQRLVSGIWDYEGYKKVVIFFFKFIESFRTILQHQNIFLSSLALTIYIWLCDVLVMYIVAKGIGIYLPILQLAFVVLTVDLIASVPVSPGALGQIELATFSLFMLVGLSKEYSSAMILTGRFITYWTFLMFSGVIAYLVGIPVILKEKGTYLDAAQKRGELL